MNAMHSITKMYNLWRFLLVQMIFISSNDFYGVPEQGNYQMCPLEVKWTNPQVGQNWVKYTMA